MIAMPWKEVNDWFGNMGIIVGTIEDYVKMIEDMHGWSPVIQDDGTIRAYHKHLGDGSAPKFVVEGEQEFDYNEWLRNPNWETLLEEYQGGDE